jgi:exopolysaccharide biosynthesis polyprenyl glycosylphosphotransferase
VTAPTVTGTGRPVAEPLTWTGPHQGSTGRGRPVWRSLATSDAVASLVVLVVVGFAAPWLRGSVDGVLRSGAVFVASSWLLLQLTLRARGVYGRARRRMAPTAFDDLAALETAVVFAALVLLALVAVAGHVARPLLSPRTVLVAFGALAVALPLGRAAVLNGFRLSPVRPARVVVLGTGTVAADVVRRMSRNRHVEVVGFVDDDPVEGQPVMGGLVELPGICEREVVDRVVVAFSRAHPARVGAVLGSLGGRVAVDVVPRYFELTGGAAELDDLDGIALVAMDQGEPTPEALRVKRVIDVVGALCGIALSSVVLLPAALAVRLSSPGPVLFRQTRLGRHRVPFEILKLRTMREPEPAERRCAAPRTPLSGAFDEHRVTAVGRVLRRTGIDELPQLVNVLRGEMSLVGPRPFVPEECSIFGGVADRRFTARPGMTGLWQVSGQHDLRLDELCRLDVHYVTAWSLGADLAILARTPARLVRGGGGAAREEIGASTPTGAGGER